MSSVARAEDLSIETTDIKTVEGIELSPRQKILVGGVLDLFKGKPTPTKLQLWAEDATFNDPLTKAQGRKQYEAQWYGLKAAFSEIETLHSQVTSTNPITLDLKSRYKIKFIGKEQIISSVVKVYTDVDDTKITGVEDRWNGNIPEGAFATVLRKINSAVVPFFVTIPKADTAEVGK
ncbi:hypothetical protein K3495_g345 [Podosphaera aphanis]|nr:hypothetical protein K3495_g345 [Podosphaera aphanis]